jgi:hypothetical protein
VIEAKGAGVRQEWSPEELLANWTLVDGDWDLVANKSGATRLGFSLLLKFFELEGRFPDVLEEVPPTAVEYVADLVKVPATDFAKYTLAGRTAEYHRKQIREALGFRPSTVADEKALAEWLAVEVCPVELVEDRQREALLVECRARKIEPPGRTRVEKVLVAARGKWEKAFCARTIGRLGEACPARLLSLVAEDNEAGTALLAALKRDPGAVGLDSLLTEITKLNDVRKLGLPDGLFADCSEKLVAVWRARAIKMYPSDFRDTSEDLRITLLAALCSSCQAEITDALVDLLVALVPALHYRRQPAGRCDEAGERHLRRPRHRMVGPGHRVCVGLEEVRVLVLELHDRVPRPLWRQRRDDLLARRAEEHLHLFPAQELFVVRGRGDDRGPAEALHGRRDRVRLRRHARGERRRVRLH